MSKIINDKSDSEESTMLSSQDEYIVGQYKLLKIIGKGEFAKVMLAINLASGEEVAIKIIDKSRFTSDGEQKLYNEIRILKMLNHPNIVKLLGVIDTPGALCLVMDYISGGDLYNYMERHGPLNEKDASTIVRQIISAVEYCHQRKIVHRDLKDDNILLDTEMNVKLIDFGMSEELKSGEKLHTFCGSLAFIAPEIFRHEKYGTEIDVWALGVILYVVLTDCIPFNGRTSEDLKAQILLGNYKIPHFVSTDCRNLIKKMLTFNPVMRPSLTSIMNDKWLNEGHDTELKPYVEEEQDQAEVFFIKEETDFMVSLSLMD